VNLYVNGDLVITSSGSPRHVSRADDSRENKVGEISRGVPLKTFLNKKKVSIRKIRTREMKTPDILLELQR
jgi:hypothetical protein